MLLVRTLVAVLVLACSGINAAEPGARPNIIVILCDDLRWDAIGCAGNPIVKTPNLDRLAARGVRFRNHFVTSSICNVSRASIFTGQYLRRHRIVDFKTPFTEQQWNATYPALLRKAGYRTGFIGKFGVGDAPPTVAAMADKFDYWRGLPGQAGLFFAKNEPNGRHKTARFGDQALEFIRSGSRTQSFCLSISFNAPHARDGQPREFWPDARDEDLYATTTIPRPPKSEEKWFAALPEVARKSEGRRRWGLRFDTEEKFQQTVKDYYRLITGIDREVGRILAALQDVAENTLVIFTSDNGFFLGERGMADKWLMYEEGIRTPLLIYDPRVSEKARGSVVDAITLNIDLAPTVLEAAGLKIPSEMQGQSLHDLIHGKRSRNWRKEFFYEHHTLPEKIPMIEGVRSERWKYVRWLQTNPVFEELFDLRNDPGETQNLAGQPQHASELRRWQRRWTTLAESLR